ncbi:MAG: hypothetical protein KGR98_14005, partial [Verrucomicrobia bacterium]|nr:hypothetical protein [Verrucomicrobiota bacterium]
HLSASFPFSNLMDQDPHNRLENVSPPSAQAGAVRNDAEGFRSVPKASEPFRNVRNDSESFRSVPKGSERKENHTLTVREAARLFEAAGVARTERSIINWCQPNRQGIARLDSYFDPNERKYYLTPQSVETVIQEEIQKARKPPEPPASEPFGKVRNDAEKSQEPAVAADQVKELERENLDLKIANRGKDFLIEQLQKERGGFFEQLLTANRKMGELESRLLQLEKPRQNVQWEGENR